RSSLAALPLPDPAVTRLREHNVAVFDTLHARLFPQTYASGTQLRAREPEHSAIFTLVEDNQLLGYVAGKVMLDTQEGYIDYVGTADRARRRGVARRIVATTLHWMFSFPEVQLVNLTVDADNAAADALYRSLGFERERVTCVYRRQVAPSKA
ncbi:MAG TPA: GNAT family N-acetyltransferase, partial [Roseiflexaceae bacterium]|nr:GNAT family N-acetyltransferase [Roseiflexaceae bacterium]